MNHKVCHISTLYSSTDTRVFQKECVSLAKHGYEVHYIVANQKDDFIEGVKIHSVKSSVSNRFQRMRNTSKKALEKALEIDAEIYHLHNPELLLISSALKKKGKKVITDYPIINSKEDLPFYEEIISQDLIHKLFLIDNCNIKKEL